MSRHAGNDSIMNTELSMGSLPAPGRARKEARSKMMWLTSCGWVQRSQEACEQACSQSWRPRSWLGFLPERLTGLTGLHRERRLLFKKTVEFLLSQSLVNTSMTGTLWRETWSTVQTWKGPSETMGGSTVQICSSFHPLGLCKHRGWSRELVICCFRFMD